MCIPMQCIFSDNVTDMLIQVARFENGQTFLISIDWFQVQAHIWQSKRKYFISCRGYMVNYKYRNISDVLFHYFLLEIKLNNVYHHLRQHALKTFAGLNNLVNLEYLILSFQSVLNMFYRITCQPLHSFYTHFCKTVFHKFSHTNSSTIIASAGYTKNENTPTMAPTLMFFCPFCISSLMCCSKRNGK